MRRHFAKAVVASVTALAVVFGSGVAAVQAAPNNKARLVSKRWIGKQLMEVKVYSPSMEKVVTNQVMTPKNLKRAPVFYLLSGMYGGNGDQWAHPAAHARKFFQKKNVYVVNPIGAASTYYTDWYFKDARLGYKPMWETYLTKELPPVINTVFKTTGRNAIAGYSMSGGTALALLAHHGNLYRAGASYSGCPVSANPAMQWFIMVSMVLNTPGVMPLNAYGGFLSPAVFHNSPTANLSKLRGKKVFVSASLGKPGMPPDDHDMTGRIDKSAIEFGAYICTAVFDQLARSSGVNVEFYKQDAGAHSFGQFGAAMKKSWPMIARALHTRV